MPGAHSPSEDRGDDRAVPVNPVFAAEPVDIPRFRIPDTGMHPEIAYQVVHDELMLDGNARLNLATFVTTWAEPQAERLMAESFDKNMIDKDEYPRTADLEQRPETPGKWMKYFETGAGERQLCRVEDFVPYHDGFASLLTAGPLMEMLAQLMGEPAALFKEKINFKLPGGAGFTAHQDAPAFTTFGQHYHLTVLIAVDPSDRSNGGLEFSDPVDVGTTLPQRPDGSISEAVESELDWRPLDLPAGSIAVFDSYIPHRSPRNESDRPRRGLYITYNRAAEGDRRADYFADKRATFPPEIERVPGVDYLANAGRYNVGNPIR